ncbi:hypothetical protein IT415_02455 [bacterium]|nr:hypothetical protein [bacterium]
MKGGGTLLASSPRYFICSHLPCTQRYFFGAKFIEIVRLGRDREGWVFWRCPSCNQINSNLVTTLEIWRLKRAQHNGHIRDIYSPEFCTHIITLSSLYQEAPEISPEEFEEMLATIYSSKLDDDVYDLCLCMQNDRMD